MVYTISSERSRFYYTWYVALLVACLFDEQQVNADRCSILDSKCSVTQKSASSWKQ